MRLRFVVAVIVASAPCACSAEPTLETSDANDLVALQRYVAEPSVGRSALEDSLVNRDNKYAKVRLARYTVDVWGRLPEWNPKTRRVTANDVGDANLSRPEIDDEFVSLMESSDDSEEALIELGRRAFATYPVQLASYAVGALSRASPATYGIHTEADGTLVGLRWVALPGGQAPGLALTCAACHASRESDGRIVFGKNNANLKLYAMLAAATGGVADDWGPGRVDVTDDGIDNAASISDLRPVRFQRNLHHAATLKNSLIALAVRTETLVITSMNESVRPPRRIAAAIALYLWSLGKEPLRDTTGPGADVFERTCSGCHQGEGLSGEPVALSLVGTDPKVGQSPDRGTGFYRVPSLRFVGDRQRLMADGAINDLDALLDPQRETPGHRFGLSLAPEERADLLDYLHAGDATSR